MEDLADSKLRDNTTCTLRSTEPNVVSFHNDNLITVDVVDLPAGAVVVSVVRRLSLKAPSGTCSDDDCAYAGVALQGHRQVPTHWLQPSAVRQWRVGWTEARLLRAEPGERLCA